MKILLKERMKSIKFCYSEEKSNIDYEEFYVNGGRFLKKQKKVIVNLILEGNNMEEYYLIQNQIKFIILMDIAQKKFRFLKIMKI